MEAIPPDLCTCRVVDGKVQFCALHENAQQLLAACEYARKFLAKITVTRKEDTDLLRELLLPYLDNVIAAAKKIEC